MHVPWRFDPLMLPSSSRRSRPRSASSGSSTRSTRSRSPQRAGAERFVFYEGPPTANGLPHPGHCLTRAIKDLFPRYRTMRGYLCERKAGWDTHGLPVEVEVCKELGIHSKEEIERYGVEPFIHKCLESVFRYTQQWERSPSGSASGSTWTTPTSRTIRATSRASGGRSRTCSTAACCTRATRSSGGGPRAARR